MSELIPPNACQDIPDLRDYHYLEVFGVWEMPRKVVNQKTTIYNQWVVHTPSTAYACTCYSATHCVNEGNADEAEQYAGISKEIDPFTIWSKALECGANVKAGWSLQGATNLIKDLWYVSGYTLCRSLGEIKQALASGQMVQTGSNKIDWIKTKANKNIVVAGASYGHAFMLEGYDDDTEIITLRNSYGPESNDHGHFYMKYKDFALLYSCYAYTDAKSDEIRNYQSVTRRALAVSRGIYNGKEDNAELIRQDAWTMAERTWTLRPVSNKKTPKMPVLRREFKTMLERATGCTIKFDIGDPIKHITRWEGAEWCVRI